MSSPFKINFDVKDYEHLYPPVPTDMSLIINANIQEPENQFWSKIREPRNRDGSIKIDEQFLYREAERAINGAWMFNKGELLWLPPDYYTFLQYANAMGKPPEFRLKRLKATYHDTEVVSDSRYMGDVVFKNRKDGETLYKTWCALMAPIRQNVTHCRVGMQSMDNDTVKGSCWMMMKSHLNGLTRSYKDFYFPDLVSDEKIQEAIRLERMKDENNPDDYGRLIIYDYGPSVFNHYDAATDLLMWLGDEWAKWMESIIQTIISLKKIAMPGFSRKGLLRLFSSPSEKNDSSNENAIIVWGAANKIDSETGISSNRLKPYYSNPMDGIENSYDKYGDADPDKCLKWIMGERRNKKGDELMQEIRGYPLPIKGTDKPNEEELFGATNDKSKVFINIQGIKNQHNKLIESNNDVVYGNLNWPDNVPFSGIPIFKQHDTNDFDEIYAKFCFSFTKFVHPNSGGDIKKAPPSYLVENVIGFDPINREMGSTNKKVKNRLSEPAGVCWRFKDTAGYGIEKEIIGSYLGPVGDQRVSQMDMLKFMLFTNSMLQIEKADGNSMMQCAYDNGMIDWMIDGRADDFVEVVDKTDNQLRKIKVKGDMPSGRGSSEFIGEIIGLINGITAPEYNESQTPDFDPVSKIKHKGVTASLSVFDPSNTEKAHFTMALGQALIGAGKLMYGKKKMKSGINNEMMKGLLGY